MKNFRGAARQGVARQGEARQGFDNAPPKGFAMVRGGARRGEAWQGGVRRGVAGVLFLFLAPALFAQTRSVALSWNDSQAGVTYNIYRSPSACPGATFGKINAAPVTAKAYTDPDIAPGVYCYYVTAEAAGLESDPSNKAEAQAKPFSPEGLSVVVEVAVTVKPSGEVVARMNVAKEKR